MTDSKVCTKWEQFVSKYFAVTWPGFIKTSLWIITAVTLIFYTIRDINNLQDDYYNNNIAAQTEVIQNVIIPKPPMMICLPYYSNALANLTSYLLLESNNSPDASNHSSPFYQWMQDHTWDIWKNDSHFVKNYYANYVDEKFCAAVRRKLLDPQTGNANFSVLIQDLDQDDAIWNQPILDCMFRLFAEISSLDFHALGSATRVDLNPPAYGGLGAWVTDEQMDQLYQLLLDIMQTVLSRGIKSDGKEEWVRESEESKNPPKIQDLKDSNVLFVQDAICFPLVSNSDSESFYMQLGRDPDPKLWSGLEGVYSIFSDIPTIFSLMSISQALFSGTTRSSLNIALQLILSPQTMIVESRLSKQDECSRENDQARCVATRQYKDVLEYCMCVPFSLKYYLHINDTSRLPYCNYSQYLSDMCLPDLVRRLPIHEDTCSYKCQKTFYQWKSFHSNRTLEDNRFFIHLDTSYERPKIPFLRFNLTDKTTREQYASSLGGIVGLYLGFSGFTACAMAILIFDLLKRWFSIGRKAIIKPKNNATSRLQLYWMVGAFTLAGQNAIDAENQIITDLKSTVNQLQSELAQIKQALNLTQTSSSSQTCDEQSTQL